jgi:hypothetical protein
MSIHFICDCCGKQLRARDEDAGKRTRCTGCTKVQRIPGGQTPSWMSSLVATHPTLSGGQVRRLPGDETAAGGAPPARAPVPSPRLAWPLPGYLAAMAAVLLLVTGMAFWLGWFSHTPEVKVVQVNAGPPPASFPLPSPPQMPQGGSFPHPETKEGMGPMTPGGMGGPPGASFPPGGGPAGPPVGNEGPGSSPVPQKAAKEPDIDSRLRLPAGYKTEGGEVVINVLGKVQGDWSLTLPTPGIKLGPVTFPEPCKLIVQMGEDRTVLAEKEGITAVDDSGNTWESRKAMLDGKKVFPFFREKLAEPPSLPGGGTGPGTPGGAPGVPGQDSLSPQGPPGVPKDPTGPAGTGGTKGPGLPPRPAREARPPEGRGETWVEVKEAGVTKVVMARAPDPSKVTVYGGSLAFAFGLGDAAIRPEVDAPGSFWIIAAGGARWNGEDLLPGRIYHVDDNRRPHLTDGAYSAWVLLGEERDVFAGPDAAGKPLYRVRADERLELRLPAENGDGVHKVRTGGPRPVEGWIKGGREQNQGGWKQLLFMQRGGQGRK